MLILFAERIRDLEYQSIAGGSQYGMEAPRAIDQSDNRTEIIIESGSSYGRDNARPRRHYYH